MVQRYEFIEGGAEQSNLKANSILCLNQKNILLETILERIS